MPWTPADAKEHTKEAKTKAEQKQWAEVANSVLAHSGDEGKAIRMANSVVRKRSK
jgi:uncharacterized protein YdaT